MEQMYIPVGNINLERRMLISEPLPAEKVAHSTNPAILKQSERLGRGKLAVAPSAKLKRELEMMDQIHYLFYRAQRHTLYFKKFKHARKLMRRYQALDLPSDIAAFQSLFTVQGQIATVAYTRHLQARLQEATRLLDQVLSVALVGVAHFMETVGRANLVPYATTAAATLSTVRVHVARLKIGVRENVAALETIAQLTIRGGK